jgi:hypothetical protein
MPKAGGQETMVTLDGSDGYAPDDTLWLWTGPRPPLPLAIFGGKRSRNNLERYFIGHALSVRQPGHVPFKVHPDGGELLMDGKLGAVQALAALDGFRDYGTFELQQIAEWVKAGGTLLCFAGDGFENALANLNTAGLCGTRPGRIRGDRAGLESFFLGKYDKSSPLFAPFVEAGLSFDTFPVFRYVELSPPKQSTTLIQLATGDPFLVREQLGKGHVFVFATGLAPRWSEFASSREFLPLFRRIVEFCQDTDSGADLAICRPFEDVGQTSGPDLSTPGILRGGERPIVANVSRQESNADLLDPKAIAYDLASSDTARLHARSVTRGQDLTTPFAVAVIAFLLLELILANANVKAIVPKKG